MYVKPNEIQSHVKNTGALASATTTVGNRPGTGICLIDVLDIDMELDPDRIYKNRDGSRTLCPICIFQGIVVRHIDHLQGHQH